MENVNNTTYNSNEDSMSSNDLLIQMFNSYVTDGGAPKVTEFKRHIDKLIKDYVKPLCIRSGKTADEHDWRSVLKAKFSGRGAKWVRVPIDSVLTTLHRLDSEGFQTADYRTHIANAGFAFLRFAGPRIGFDNMHAAAFEVRTTGSTIDHPKQLHYIEVDFVDDIVKPLGGTPHSLKLDIIAKPQDVVDPPIDLGAMCDKIVEERMEDASDTTLEDEFDMEGILSDLTTLEADAEDNRIFDEIENDEIDSDGFIELR